MFLFSQTGLNNDYKFSLIVKPWSKSESKSLSQQAPKLIKSPKKKERKKDLDLGPPTPPPPNF